jgi:adenylate cyclase class 2
MDPFADDGSAVTLTVKEVEHDGIDGTTETEVVVGDFETANEPLRRMGFEAKSYQENRRESFELAGARLEIDRWPLIPPYLEVEGDSRQHVGRSRRDAWHSRRSADWGEHCEGLCALWD